MKICRKCNNEKELISFNQDQLTRKKSYCRQCLKELASKRYIENKEIYSIKNKKYRVHNKERLSNKRKDYYKKNKEYLLGENHKYYIKNKEKLNQYKNTYDKVKRLNDPIFKLKSNITRSINYVFSKNNTSKNRSKTLNYVSWTLDELKTHIESLFEPWMNWDNYGSYKIEEWDDEDQLTWKWQLDHIIPQDYLPYDSMEHENFKKCWALENLRPYSAKQNLLDGNRRFKIELDTDE